MLLLKLLNLFIGDLNLGFIVHFVRENHDLDVRPGVLVNLIEPDGDALEAFAVGQVEDDDDAVSALVIRVRDRAVALLACRVPNLQLDRRLVDLHRAEAEIHPDRADVVLLEAVVLCPQQRRKLTIKMTDRVQGRRRS